MTAPRFFCRGFTLLELMVAIAVTALIGVLIVQIIAATTAATRQSNKGIDAAAQARLAFDRLGMDLAARVRRSDVDFFAGTNGDFLAFYSEVTSAGVSSADNRGVSVVGYRIGTNAETPRRCLLRAAKAIAWSDAGFVGKDTNGLPAKVTAPSDPDALAPALLHTAVGFQLYPDGQPARLADGRTIPEARGQVVYSPPVREGADGLPSDLVDPGRIAALIVGVVAMDPQSAELLEDSQVAALADGFPSPADGELPVAKWAAIADNPANFPSSIPLPARQSLRVFQRAFPVNPYSPQ